MSSREFTVGMLFLSQTTVGILGNFSLLHHYVFLHFTGGRLRSTDLIVSHLTVANSLVILSKGIPQTLTAFGWKDFLSDFGCEFLFFVHRVSRGVSMGSTCLLSMFQAITISPSNSRWAELKRKAPKYIGPSTVLCWVLHILVNIVVPVYMIGNWGNKTLTKKKDLGYCSSAVQDITTRLLYVVLFSFPDVVCLGLMTWASGCTVFILYRHKQRVQHIHRNNISARSSPESRATQSILILVSTFVGFYTLSCILTLCVTLLHSATWWLVNIAALSAASFPTVSPFALLSHDSRVSRLCRVGAGDNTQFSHLIKKI
ncbi:vomeronasal type-1 receptor 2-like [Orycteropus afer afer]|uniref:Vomeronasal type-1 receptor 2-like n=1 Tax=Orycteropus afer afer TaxID=1230840 RepID=A0AC54ZFT8_ORYAF|nr:vomeronasal type-1 receptor 2-like [Orycteropus afer afer]